MRKKTLLKSKFLKSVLGMVVAISTISNCAIPAFAANVEVSSDGTGTKSQTVEVSTENITSMYTVSLPATIELTRQTVKLTDKENPFESYGYWVDFQIGAAGKLLYYQSLSANIKYDFETSTGVTLTGTQDSRNTIELKSIQLTPSGYEVVTAGSCGVSWSAPGTPGTNIGSCDYDGSSLVNCNYSTKSMWLGVPFENILKPDTYRGNIVVEFSLYDKPTS